MNLPKPMNWRTRIFLLLWCLVPILMFATDVFEPFRREGSLNFYFWLCVAILNVSSIAGEIIERWRGHNATAPLKPIFGLGTVRRLGSVLPEIDVGGPPQNLGSICRGQSEFKPRVKMVCGGFGAGPRKGAVRELRVGLQETCYNPCHRSCAGVRNYMRWPII